MLLVLFVCIVLSALGVSYCAHWSRQLLNELYGELSVRDKAQAALDTLLPPQRGAFVKEDGERVVDEHGRRVARA